MTEKETKLYAVLSQIRMSFNQLKMLSELLLDDMGVNPSMRAVMEFLSKNGPQTVPEIAKNKGVSRQHIQLIINMLQKDSYVESSENPAHKRSALFSLTSKGQKIFKQVLAKEVQPLRNIALKMSTTELQQTEVSLANLNKHLNTEISKGDSNE